MRVTRPTTPCYCSECDASQSLKVRWNNPRVAEQGSIGLCAKHAQQMASQILEQISTTSPVRPRIVRDRRSSAEFRCVNGILQFRDVGNGFNHWDDDVIPRFVNDFPAVMVPRYRLWADLMETPDEASE